MRVGHGGLGFGADVTVPRFHGTFVEHPVAGPQQHEHGDQRAHAFADFLDRTGASEQEREEHGDQTGAGKAREHAEVNPLGEAPVAGFDEVGHHGGHHQQRFETLADQDEERLSGGAGDGFGEGVDVAGRATVEGGRVFDEPAFQVVDEFLDLLVGTAVTHGLAGHFELVFHLRDAVAGDGVHDVLFEAELFVVLVVRVVDEAGAFCTLAGDGGLVRLVEDDVHFAGDFAPRAVAFAFGRILFGRVELLTFRGGLFGALLRVGFGVGEVRVAVKRLRGGSEVRVQRIDFAGDRAALALLVGEAFQVGELCEQRLLLVGGNGVVDGLREVGGVVADPMRGLEAGAGLAVIAVVVVFFGGGELLGDVLRSGGPGIEIRLAVVGGGRLLRHHGAGEQRGERDHQRGDERGETAGSRDARTARIVGTGCVALRDAR